VRVHLVSRALHHLLDFRCHSPPGYPEPLLVLPLLAEYLLLLLTTEQEGIIPPLSSRAGSRRLHHGHISPLGGKVLLCELCGAEEFFEATLVSDRGEAMLGRGGHVGRVELGARTILCILGSAVDDGMAEAHLVTRLWKRLRGGTE
jgi:hypothetical protein